MKGRRYKWGTDTIEVLETNEHGVLANLAGRTYNPFWINWETFREYYKPVKLTRKQELKRRKLKRRPRL